MEHNEKSLPPNTTAQQDLTVEGQRRVNLIWEFTQAAIAIIITIALVVCEFEKIDSSAVRMAFALIIGFYFSRTNHQAIGGIGDKPVQRYEGR